MCDIDKLFAIAKANQSAHSARGRASLSPAQYVQRHKAMFSHEFVADPTIYTQQATTFLSLVARQPHFSILSARNYWADVDKSDALSIFVRLTLPAAGDSPTTPPTTCDVRFNIVTPELVAIKAAKDKYVGDRLAANPTALLASNMESKHNEEMHHAEVEIPLGACSIGTPSRHNQALSHDEFDAYLTTVSPHSANSATLGAATTEPVKPEDITDGTDANQLAVAVVDPTADSGSGNPPRHANHVTKQASVHRNITDLAKTPPTDASPDPADQAQTQPQAQGYSISAVLGVAAAVALLTHVATRILSTR